jgi:hypothetical protein
MSNTTTSSPTVSPEVAEKAAGIKCKMHQRKAREMAEKNTATPAQLKIAGTALLATLGVKEDASLEEAVTLAINRREAMGILQVDLESAIKAVVEAVEQGKWDELASIAAGDDSQAPADPAPAPEPQPEEPAGRGITLTIPKIEIPHVAEPADGMTKALLSAMEPRIKALSAGAAADAAQKIGTALHDLVKQLNALTPTTVGKAGVDEEEVKGIVNKALNNGTGEQIKKLVSSETPGAIKAVLEKAAELVAAAAPGREASKPKLEAAYLPIPDPNYHWTPDLEAFAKLIAKQLKDDGTQNGMLVGPSGCGKTEFASQLAAKLSRKFFAINCGTLREARDWWGKREVANGQTFFEPSQFVLAAEEGGVVILFNELNRAAPHLHNPLMGLLDDNRRAFIPDIGRWVVVGPETLFLADQNEGLNFTGTHQTDEALQQRFIRRLELNYLPENAEVEVLTKKVKGLKADDARKLVQIANTIRGKAAQFGGGISKGVSTRQLIVSAKDFTKIGPVAFKNTIISHYTADGGNDSERAQVIKMFEGKGYRLA